MHNTNRHAGLHRLEDVSHALCTTKSAVEARRLLEAELLFVKVPGLGSRISRAISRGFLFSLQVAASLAARSCGFAFHLGGCRVLYNPSLSTLHSAPTDLDHNRSGRIRQQCERRSGHVHCAKSTCMCVRCWQGTSFTTPQSPTAIPRFRCCGW